MSIIGIGLDNDIRWLRRSLDKGQMMETRDHGVLDFRTGSAQRIHGS
jgi:hypothetical protein